MSPKTRPAMSPAASLGRAALAAGLMAGLVFGLMGMLPPLSLPWQAILYGSLAVAAYLLFSWLLQSPELVALPRLLRRG